MLELRQREPRMENRRLLDLAHRVERCQHCMRYADPGCEPAHENGLEAGKGQSTKSHDNRHAALCHDCHVWYDTGKKSDPTGLFTAGEKAAVWDRAHKRTFDLYWRRGWLEVCG